MLLAGDIGGTKTALAMFSPASGSRTPVVQREYRSAGYASLVAIIQEFLTEVNQTVEVACFDVAGPVFAGRAKVTNLPWEIDGAELKDLFNLRAVYLLNDLEALALAVPLLEQDDLHTLNVGEPVAGGAIAVVAPGTGLGEAFLTWDGARYQAHPSEGGHTGFAPANAQQRELLAYLQQKYNHVSMERVCSGLGLPNLYDFLRDSGYAAESPELAQQLAAAQDRTPIIVAQALRGSDADALCQATLTMFEDILATEASNMALKVLATGGVYLGGGIPARILGHLQAERFMQVFQHKGRFADMLRRVPVHVIKRQAALMGVADYGLQRMASA